MRRMFLGSQRPALLSAVDFLWQQYGPSGQQDQHTSTNLGWDLSATVLVLPGGRAGRRLNELLAMRAHVEGVAYLPPQVTTIGQLPELLYSAKRPFATRFVQQLVWSNVLRQASPATLTPILAAPPSAQESDRWLELASVLWRQHRELAAEGLRFEDVAQQVGVMRDTEVPRWKALSELQRAYLEALDGYGLWDKQTARLYAIAHQECVAHQDILMVATVDMGLSMRRMLDQVRERVTVLVYADQTDANRFDEMGCVRPDVWQAADVPLRDDQIRQVDGPTDQARAVTEFLVSLEGAYASDEVTIGVPDETLVTSIERSLEQLGGSVRYGPGTSVEGTRPVRLIRAVVDYLQQRTVSAVMDLLRHPDVARTLQRHQLFFDDDLAALDDVYREHLPTSVSGLFSRSSMKTKLERSPTSLLAARRLIDAVEEWLKGLSGATLEPSDWTTPLLELLDQVYGNETIDMEDDRQRKVCRGCEALRDAMDDLRKIPSKLIPPVTATEAILMALASLSAERVAPAANLDAIELVGWLDLTLDDGLVKVITNFNEGFVPTSSNSDLFLPDALRRRLGIDDNRRRYARDAYSLTVLAKSCDRFQVIFGRRDEQGDPLMPSRLLFATDEVSLVRRSLRFFGESGDDFEGDRSVDEAVVCVASTTDATTETHQFLVPSPKMSESMECGRSLSVTDFRAYLACPYRFYLSRVLKLRDSGPEPEELDGAAFGNRLHEVLERFGQSSTADSANAQDITEFLVTALREGFRAKYGTRPRAVIQLQMAQMQSRLESFAQSQAQWRRNGWKILYTESEGTSVEWCGEPSDEPISLRGRIDRIDRNEETGQFAILDYKSSDLANTPGAVHHPGSREPKLLSDWHDLQLPLYRHLAQSLGVTGENVKLGYVTLPRSVDGGGFRLAGWNDQHLEQADRVAWDVVSAIRAGRFWPPADTPPWSDAGVDRICQSTVFERRLATAVETLE